MQISHLITRPCVLTRRTDSGATDDYGNPVPTETEVVTVCELQQERRAEPGDQGEMSDAVWLLVLPAGTEVGSGDVVTVDGEAYELVGAPWQVRHPRTGQMTHIEATVRRTA